MQTCALSYKKSWICSQMTAAVVAVLNAETEFGNVPSGPTKNTFPLPFQNIILFATKIITTIVLAKSSG